MIEAHQVRILLGAVAVAGEMPLPHTSCAEAGGVKGIGERAFFQRDVVTHSPYARAEPMTARQQRGSRRRANRIGPAVGETNSVLRQGVERWRRRGLARGEAVH